MSKNISNTLRQKIAERAGFRCEYCLLTEAVSFYSFHAEHIRSKKHGGKSGLQNLAYSCPDCNYFKAQMSQLMAPAMRALFDSLIQEKTIGKSILKSGMAMFLEKLKSAKRPNPSLNSTILKG